MGGRIVIALAATVCAPALCARAAAQDPPLRTVLTITAGAENFPANPIIDGGVGDALASRTDLPIDYFTEYSSLISFRVKKHRWPSATTFAANTGAAG